MEGLLSYLIKSAVWITGFAVVYMIFLQNERYFILNRMYLVTGILASVLFPLITVHYIVEMPALRSAQPGGVNAGGFELTAVPGGFSVERMLLVLYAAGVLIMISRYLLQSFSVVRSIRDSERLQGWPVKIVCHPANVTPFSFFSWVVVNPSLTDTETREIMNHEMVHVRQRHWLDLLLTGLLCTVQWFNPVVWIYARFIRQNHEYLADEEALRTTSDPALYRAALLNQIAGTPVIDLGNSFNYSLSKKRFHMMKNIVTSPARKLRLLLILPVSVMILYAFAEPEYKIVTSDEVIYGVQGGSDVQTRTAKGIVVSEDGKPLQGAAVVLKGTTIGTLSDQQGRFSLDKVPSDGLLVISFVGFETKVVDPVFGYDMIVKMPRATFVTDTVEIAPPPPPPPPVPSGTEEPLYVIDGEITDRGHLDLAPENVESINILKGESATAKYGDKGKNGVILITMKKTSPEVVSVGDPAEAQGTQGEDEKYVVIEEMPQFPGGDDAMRSWISNNVRYPSEAIAQKISGLVYVNFTVGATGKVSNAQINKSVHPLLDAEALRVIAGMPYWKPGRQHGRPVDVGFSVPVEFKLDGSKIMMVQKTK